MSLNVLLILVERCDFGLSIVSVDIFGIILDTFFSSLSLSGTVVVERYSFPLAFLYVHFRCTSECLIHVSHKVKFAHHIFFYFVFSFTIFLLHLVQTHSSESNGLPTSSTPTFSATVYCCDLVNWSHRQDNTFFFFIFTLMPHHPLGT